MIFISNLWRKFKKVQIQFSSGEINTTSIFKAISQYFFYLLRILLYIHIWVDNSTFTITLFTLSQ